MPKLPDFVTRDISDQTDVEMEVDLEKMFGGPVPNSSEFRQAVGQDIIDTIRKRTKSEMESWTGSNFSRYSDSYTESIDFKAYGKSQSKPNLTQTGGMLGSLDVVKEQESKIFIGFDDKTESEKAHGHITGNVGAKRDFFGLTSEEAARIVKRHQKDLYTPDQTGRKVNSSVSRLRNFVLGETEIRSNASMQTIIDTLFGAEE